jgi:hypothetical protein
MWFDGGCFVAPLCRSYCLVNTFVPTFCASGLISVLTVYFDASYADALNCFGCWVAFGVAIGGGKRLLPEMVLIYIFPLNF